MTAFDLFTSLRTADVSPRSSPLRDVSRGYLDTFFRADLGPVHMEVGYPR